NRAITHLFGYHRSEIIGQHVNTFLTADSREIAAQQMRAGYEKPYELEGVRKDDSIFPLEVHAKEVSYQGIHVRVAALRDISIQKQTEESLRQAKETSEAANRAKSTFLANMSHELRTPLNAILGFARLMTRNSRIPPEEQENLAIIQRSGDHLLTLINQVLDLSKIEAGRITLNEKTFDLYKLLDELEDLFSFKAQEAGLQVLFERLDYVPQYICSDDVKLRQVLINLLSNAVKFTEEGGVAVRVRRLMIGKPSKEPNQSTIDNQQSTIAFEIEDTGPGIASDELNNLFEAFVQTESGRQAQEGTGLGLPISRKFIQLMGGDISVKSEVGHGTTFRFEIPIGLVEQSTSDNQQLTSAKRVIALEAGQLRYRILVVDDKADNRKLLVKLLSSLSAPNSGFELREAVNGEEAVEIRQDWEPHLIWMDLRMPVMDGYEASRIIREHDTQDTKIIVLSASSFEDDRTRALSKGCDDFLRKPFRDSEIFDLLHKHLGVRFVYEEEKHSTLDKELTPDDLAALPDDLRAELQKVITIADIQMATRLVERIRPQNEVLADALTALLHDYRFDILDALFEKA
ncbi:MAG: response regulator, partial [bacterium]|nr:response regulator [bacterium]